MEKQIRGTKQSMAMTDRDKIFDAVIESLSDLINNAQYVEYGRWKVLAVTKGHKIEITIK